MSSNANRRAFFQNLAAPSRVKEAGLLEQSQSVSRYADINAEQQISRFLAQATLGPNKALIDYVGSIGIEAWLDEQFNSPQSEIYAYMQANLYDESKMLERFPERHLFRYALWDHMINGNDLLRQRVALALAEIFVISTEVDEIYSAATGVGMWYDMLLKHAFGNFRDLLFDVTVSPMMGRYLSHAGNRKTDLNLGRFPDENYAREIMQLFSIGLFYLNEDGSLELDGNGEPIPTYDNSHITEFAKIFTGLNYDHDGDPYFGDDWEPTFENAWVTPHSSVRPMKMFEEVHEPGPKTLLEGYVVPAGQSGMQDINAALDHLFWHQNTPPFIVVGLIKFLVKSNPSPDYIYRVVQVFKDNGSGVRGDMQATVRAILLDDEARSLYYITDPTNGRMREPFFKLVQLMRAFDYANPQNKYWDSGWRIEREIRQFPFNAQSVFNFFSPGFVPAGPLAANQLTGPEFQTLNSYTAISIINFWYETLDWKYVFDLPDENTPVRGATVSVDQPQPNLAYLTSLVEAEDFDTLMYFLDTLFTYGTLSQASWDIIKSSIVGYAAEETEGTEAVVRFAIFLFMVSPEYNIQV
ncbi:MAG: DUF1800 family protein [Chloroflexota bacterium]